MVMSTVHQWRWSCPCAARNQRVPLQRAPRATSPHRARTVLLRSSLHFDQSLPTPWIGAGSSIRWGLASCDLGKKDRFFPLIFATSLPSVTDPICRSTQPVLFVEVDMGACCWVATTWQQPTLGRRGEESMEHRETYKVFCKCKYTLVADCTCHVGSKGK